jgi:hypothetical protein
MKTDRPTGIFFHPKKEKKTCSYLKERNPWGVNNFDIFTIGQLKFKCRAAKKNGRSFLVPVF